MCDALDVGPGDQITWEVNGGRGSRITMRITFYYRGYEALKSGQYEKALWG